MHKLINDITLSMNFINEITNMEHMAPNNTLHSNLCLDFSNTSSESQQSAEYDYDNVFKVIYDTIDHYLTPTF